MTNHLQEDVPLEAARSTQAKIWFIGSAIPFLILVIQAILGKYEPDTQAAFSWFIPTVFPTLTLMISVIGAASIRPRENRFVRQDFLKITTGISYLYLTILTLILALKTG